MGYIDKFMLTGKTAVVTGGSRGIGFVVAKGFAEVGANVVILDILDGEGPAKEIAGLGVKTLYIKTDVTVEQEVEAAFARVVEQFGTVDVVFNNAGSCINADADKMSYEDWRKIVRLDLDACFLVAAAAGRIMLKQGKGSIVNTASMSGHIVNYPQPQCGYNAAKAGVIHLTKSMAVEWAKKGVRVNSISPGYINTPMTAGTRQDWKDFWWTITPMGRIGEPEELVGAVIYLASDASTYTTGCDIVVDGGFVCV